MFRRKRTILLAIVLLLALFYATTYIPQKLVHIDPASVGKIHVFDGNTGLQIDITETDDIQHIVNNLNHITFHKGKLSLGYMGYSFRTTIYNKKGKVIKRFIINSSDTIRYNGFFYKTQGNMIEYDYMKQLFEQYPTKGA